ncbi:PIN domain-containing protein [Dactylosporangium sp. AC04546]|uniref:PIN domain-containing protein n=1 Tax=Dactylosporangium sp. AC04546 TaxID=2862460 RepID=UPI001EE106F7|nr:PIN domain-containing protein [Dactylosporangium sp. AC04546]WVK81734.1 PIN domain-containing protein [Dactylosporangium sp. AC04546]
MKYLADTSALVRIYRGQVSDAWQDAVDRGLVTLTEPALTELLTVADAKRYLELERDICETYPWATIPDNIWGMVSAIRHELVEPSVYQDVSVADLVIAATAIRLKLVVLHEDGDFETIARHVPELRQQRISAVPA